MTVLVPTLMLSSFVKNSHSCYPMGHFRPNVTWYGQRKNFSSWRENNIYYALWSHLRQLIVGKFDLSISQTKRIFTHGDRCAIITWTRTYTWAWTHAQWSKSLTWRKSVTEGLQMRVYHEISQSVIIVCITLQNQSAPSQMTIEISQRLQDLRKDKQPPPICPLHQGHRL